MVKPTGPPESLIKEVTPSESTLLDWLRFRLSRAMLEEIARNDYSEEVEAHLAEIENQLGSAPVLGFLPWNPREVLELERWNEPDFSWGEGPPTGAHGHLKRILACTILLRNTAFVAPATLTWEEQFFVEAAPATALQLLRSAISVGGEVPRLAVEFLLWVHERQPHPASRPFIAFSVLLLQTHTHVACEPPSNLLATCAWVESEEASCRCALGKATESERWLTGLNTYEDKTPYRVSWAFVAEPILKKAYAEYPADVQSALRRIELLLQDV